jgi:hypothetical protein
VAIPRPRSLDSMAGPEFNRCKSELLAALRAAGGLPGAAVQEPAR